MSYSLIIEPEAEVDLRDALRWYENQRMGLGEEFLLGIEAVPATIPRRPKSFAIVRGEMRRAIVRRFPYGVFFVMGRKTIQVIAVLHARQNPSIWKRRLKRR